MAKKSENKFSSVEKSWMLYDFTTNGYATIILTAIFPIYFNVVLGQNTLGLELKGYAASFVMLISAIICPFLGAIADVNKMKKRLWAGFALAGAVIVGAMAATSSWELLLAAYVLSNLAYNFAMLFYDSFITDVTDHERMHKVSTWAYAVGYVGGGFVLLVITAVLMFTTSSVIAVKTSFILTALWWVIFSLPMLFNVHQTHFSEKNLSETTHEMLGQLRQTFGAIWANKPLRYFILAYFFYIDGVGTVMTMATSYGNTIGLGTTGMILALLVTQLLGLPFSILFGRLADR
ncbi:MAG: MFS transporter, partial [Streptococcaceae bacterium]|nr:MFS transporter [Streptococcaceae bacterium]